MFDGDKFTVWKYHMEMCFEEKDVMLVVNGTISKLPNNALDLKKIAWKNGKRLFGKTQVWHMISSFVSLSILENLVNYFTAACMWTILYVFYQCQP